jgi:eukaryotic-like serine/threonine-protein kinase
MFEGRFSKLRTIGAGAMGKVYKAWDEAGQRPVALKVLEAKDTSNRFEREAVVLSQLVHPNIVTYVAHGVTREGQPWLAMEWLEGKDLEACLRGGPLAYEDTLRVARGVAGGLAWAHARGFVHRDLKPSNVFVIDKDFNQVKIVDFGLARGDFLESPITRTGTFMGTIEYMPPEQVHDAKRADTRADVYSLGAVLFHCMTGQAPHLGASLIETVQKCLHEDAPPMSSLRPDSPAAFEALVATMLRRDKDERPADGAAVSSELARLDAGYHPRFEDIPIDVDAPTMMADPPRDLLRRTPVIPAPPPSAPRGAGFNVSPKSGTVIIPVQPLPVLPPPPAIPTPPRLPSSPGSEPPPPPVAEDKRAWLGVVLLSLVILAAVGLAAWRSLQ